MQAAQKNDFANYASFAANLDVSDNGRRGVVPGSSKEKLSMQAAFRTVNDQQVVGADRDALAGSMLMDCLFGACLGVPTVDLGGGVEAGLDMVADVVDEFWMEMRRKDMAAQAPKTPAANLSMNFWATEPKKKGASPQAFESWMAPAPYVLQPTF